MHGHMNVKFKVKNPSWSLKMRPLGCPEMSVRNYNYTLRNGPEHKVFSL